MMNNITNNKVTPATIIPNEMRLRLDLEAGCKNLEVRVEDRVMPFFL
jgi:hypothetical protein